MKTVVLTGLSIGDRFFEVVLSEEDLASAAGKLGLFLTKENPELEISAHRKTLETLKTAVSEKNAVEKRAEELDRVGTQGWDIAKQLGAENKKLRGELAAREEEVRVQHSDAEDFRRMANAARRELATIAEKTAREQRESDKVFVTEWLEGEIHLPSKVNFANEAITYAPLVTDAPSKVERKACSRCGGSGQVATTECPEGIHAFDPASPPSAEPAAEAIDGFDTFAAAQQSCVSAVGDKYTNAELDRLAVEYPASGPGFKNLTAAIRRRNALLAEKDAVIERLLSKTENWRLGCTQLVLQKAAQERLIEQQKAEIAELTYARDEACSVCYQVREFCMHDVNDGQFDHPFKNIADLKRDLPRIREENKRLRAKCSRQRKELRRLNQYARLSNKSHYQTYGERNTARKERDQALGRIKELESELEKARKDDENVQAQNSAMVAELAAKTQHTDSTGLVRIVDPPKGEKP